MSLLQLAKKIEHMENIDRSQGAYPMDFKDEWTKAKFVLFLKWLRFIRKVRRK